MTPPVSESTGGITVCAAAPVAPATMASDTAMTRRLTASAFIRPPPAARRREVDQERHDDADDRHHRPLPAEPVLHRRVPEQRRGKEDESQQWPEDGREDPVEPAGEEPQESDREPRRGQRDQD